jgi:hypothetical protein
MRNRKKMSISAASIYLCLAAMLATSSVSLGDYLKMNPPPDIDKEEYTFPNGKSCWVAAASNMLAGAGYGDGNSVQERADDIYRELCGHLVDCDVGGWEDTAINTWRYSNFNNCPNNPYIVINAHGDRTTRPPYPDANLPMLLGNDLRKCNFVALSLTNPASTTGGHAVTCWGDNGADINQISSNPTQIKITDSDFWDKTQTIQTYTYDDYYNPDPNHPDCNKGNGCYFDYYSTCHWYIDGFVTFEAAKNFIGSYARTLVASAQFTYNGDDPCAVLLHYKIYSNYTILSYRTSIDWDTNVPPAFFEDNNSVNVTWNLNNHPVPQGTTITVTAEIVGPHYDIGPATTISIGDIGWKVGLIQAPGGGWWSQNTALPGGSTLRPIQNMCGGYVVCAGTLYASPTGPPIGEYRGQFKYDHYEDPCQHMIIFAPEPSTYFMGNFRFGHSYGLLTDNGLKTFSDWKTVQYQYPPFQSVTPITFMLDWTGTLPYPRGQDYVAPKNCGDPGTQYAYGDINKDCKVDWQDFALFADSWLTCTEPNQANCP